MGEPTRVAPDATERHLRGSSLLLVGRLIAILINFAGQVVVVRYLSRADYGAFAWALAVVSLGTVFNLAGLGRTASRLMPAFDETGDRPAARGTLRLAVGALLGLGVAAVAIVVGGQSLLADHVAGDALSVELLVAAVLLVPLTAFDSLLQEVSAFLIGARAIFFRRHLLGPLLKLVAVIAVVALRADAHALAVGHVIAGAIGVLAYVVMLARAPAARWLKGRPVRYPLRDVTTFAFPVLINDTIGILAVTLAIVVIESYHGPDAVAPFRAVLPVGGLILVALQSFRFLFMPLASRFQARGEVDEVGSLLVRSNLWIATLSFPAFAVCFALSEPLVKTLFGDRYADAAGLLSLVSVAMYVNAALGLHADSLMAFGRMRLLVGVSVGALAVRASLLFALVPAHAAQGAAVATAIAGLVHNVANAAAAPRACGFTPSDRRSSLARARWVGAALALAAMHFLMDPGLGARLVAVAAASTFVLVTNRQALAVGSTFPALAKIPLVGKWMARLEDEG